jgi:hypothetical protein
LGDAGQGAGQHGGVDLAVELFVAPLVRRPSRLQRLQQRDLGGQIGGQRGEEDGVVGAVQPDRLGRRLQPRLGLAWPCMRWLTVPTNSVSASMP